MKRTPAYEGKNNYIFVSYAHKDSELVLPMIDKLYEEKYRVWYDEGIRPGSEWPHNIEVHLKGCSTALIYISKNSLASINCENEVVNAINYKKRIIQYSLDGSIHPLIKEKAIDNVDDLMKTVTSDLIGDGTGYDRNLHNKNRFSIWNVLLILSIVLFVGLIGGIYLLNEGYFDEYLPGKNYVEEVIDVKPTENIEVNNDIIAQAILEQLGQQDLFKEVEFVDDNDRLAMYDALNIDNDNLTYYDLTKIKNEEVSIKDCSEECLKLFKYLPELKILIMDSDKVFKVDELNNCAKLETLKLTKKTFPVEIKDNYRFKIQYIKSSS